MLTATQDVLNRALKLSKEFGYGPAVAVAEAFSDEIGFGSTDMLSSKVLDELHTLGLLLEFKIIR